MLLKSFQGFQPRQAFYVLLAGLLCWIPAFLFPGEFPAHITIYPSPADTILQPLMRLSGFSLAVVSFLFWLLVGYLLVILNLRHLFLKTRTILPLFFMLTLSTPLFPFFEINNLTLTFPFLLLSIHLVFKTYRNNNIDFSFFMAAFWVGIASMICVKSSSFLIIIWIALLILRPFYYREWFVSLAGFLTSWILLFGFYFLAHHNISMLATNTLNEFHTPFKPVPINYLQQGVLLYTALLTFISTGYMFFKLPGLKIKLRRFHLIFFWISLLAVLLWIIFPGSWNTSFPLFCLSLFYLLSFFFSTEKASFIKQILFDLYAGGIIAVITITFLP